jgi:hypothetical protein
VTPTPCATFVMPCRDAAATVAEAVRSIRAQDRADWELLLVDDGSRDGSADVAEGAAEHDPRVRVLRRPPRGIVAALNEGVETARGSWIARLDADDLCTPDRLRQQMDWVAGHPELSLVGGLVEAFPADALTDGMRHYLAWLNAVVTPGDVDRDLLVESPFAHPSVTFRRDAVRAAGGYREGPFPEDYDLWLRLHGAGHRLGKVPSVVVHWRDGPGRLTRTDPRYAPGAFRDLKARHLATTFLAGRDACQVWGAGPDGRRWRRALAGVGIRVARFFDIDPRKVGRVLGGGAPVLHWREVPAWRGCPLLVAVGTKGARAQVREALCGLGLVETADFVCVQ